ncbi:DUF3261 domain-containing protein [Stenotrophomonas maltophilia]|uniref:DUF3261 domain-containing protein n=1 Tax=Stenotrophomonas maltophilia TaxID=40324 RepID=UPI003D18A130
MPRPQVELPSLRLAPSSLPTPLALQQQLHFRFGRHERDLDALLEADAQQVQLAVQAMGQTGVRLRWDGRQLTEQRASWLPPQVRAERVLDDLQFALWPTAAIAAVLPAGWQVGDDGHQRSLSRDGTVWLQLQRLQDGSLQLDNRAEGYTLRIESIYMAGQD